MTTPLMNVHNSVTPRQLLDQLLSILYARKLLILLVFLATVGGAYVYLQFQSDQYEAEAALLVRLGRENVETPVTVSKGIVNTIGVREEEVNSNIQLLSSMSLIEQTVDRIGLDAFEFTPQVPTTLFQKVKAYLREGYKWVRLQLKTALITLGLKKDLTKRQDVLVLAKTSLTVERAKASDVIVVRMRLPDPNLAMRFVNELLSIYMQRHSEVRHDANVTPFFRAQVRDYEKLLSDLDKQLIKLRDESNISSVEHQRELLLGRLHALREKLEEAENERVMVQKRQASAERPEPLPTSSTKPSFEVIPNPSVGALKERLTSRHLERVSIAESDTSESLAFKRLETEIDSLEELLRRGLDVRIGQLKEREQAIDSELRGLNAAEVNLDRIKREKNVAEQNYYIYTKRMEEARIDDELNRDSVVNVTVIYPAGASIEPVAPRKMLIMYIALAVGLALGVGLALVPEYLDDSIRSEEDVLAIEGVPYLGSFRFPKRSRWEWRRWPGRGSIVTGPLLSVGSNHEFENS